MTASYKLSSIF